MTKPMCCAAASPMADTSSQVRKMPCSVSTAAISSHTASARIQNAGPATFMETPVLPRIAAPHATMRIDEGQPMIDLHTRRRGAQGIVRPDRADAARCHAKPA
ncbi:MAG TPA: hypothetical protein VET87_06665 [Rubrivivax sp.]|nr:hypothetical protein [Rubrivivax sp.]